MDDVCTMRSTQIVMSEDKSSHLLNHERKECKLGIGVEEEITMVMVAFQQAMAQCFMTKLSHWENLILKELINHIDAKSKA